MAYCANCGKELPNEAEFCDNCGKEINSPDFQKQIVHQAPQKSISKKKVVLATESIKYYVSKFLCAMPNPVFAVVVVLLVIYDIIDIIQGYSLDIGLNIIVLLITFAVTEKWEIGKTKRSESERTDENCICEEEADSSDSQRKTVYDGEIHKCPNCGELLKAFVAECPACGYEYRGAKSSEAALTFSRKYNDAQNEDQKISLLRSFPVPNTREDIFEFMILASTNLTLEQSKKLFDAWLIKFEQAYKKAELILKNDSDISSVKDIYNQTHKKINKTRAYFSAKAAGTVITKSGSLTSKIIAIILKNMFVPLGLLAYLKAIQIDRIGDNGVGYELLGGILLIASASLLTKRATSYFEIALGVAGGILTFYLSKFLHNGAGLQLFGAITLLIAFIAFIKRAINGNGSKEK